MMTITVPPHHREHPRKWNRKKNRYIFLSDLLKMQRCFSTTTAMVSGENERSPLSWALRRSCVALCVFLFSFPFKEKWDIKTPEYATRIINRIKRSYVRIRSYIEIKSKVAEFVERRNLMRWFWRNHASYWLCLYVYGLQQKVSEFFYVCI